MHPDEAAMLAVELTMLKGKRSGARSLIHEMNAFTGHELYLSSVLLSVTPPPILVFYAEKITPTSVGALIVRIHPAGEGGG
ncbi:hypothetical protein CF327_g7562 [Tilletia walkeri]|nr:hypothetical protein CF327_g7562 [Tilletia walkeri]